MKQLDLLFGNPTFLQDNKPNRIFGEGSVHFAESDHQPYLRSNTYDPLVTAIRELHKKAGNIEIMDTDEIVISVGATQNIFATFNVLYGKTNHSPPDIHIESPMWFRFSKITEMSGIKMTSHTNNLWNAKEFLVLPNNPTNALRMPTVDCPAVDCCYLWPWYFRKSDDYKTATEILEAVAPKVAIFSLAKTTGHCASRIGWSIVKDKEVAKEMRSYIEYSSGGTSIEAQCRATVILEGLTRNYDTKAVELQSALEDRWIELDHTYFDHIKILNLKAGGMFLWAQCTHPDFYAMLASRGILFMEGYKCGGHLGTARFNMGVPLETLNYFIEELKQIDQEIGEKNETSSNEKMG